jgi:hypothetical protein
MGKDPPSASPSEKKAERVVVGGGGGGDDEDLGLPGKRTTSTDVSRTQFNASQADRTRQLSKDLAASTLDTQLTRSIIRPSLTMGVQKLRDIQALSDKDLSTRLRDINFNLRNNNRLVEKGNSTLTNGDNISDRVRSSLNRTLRNSEDGLRTILMTRNRLIGESRARGLID